MKKFLLATTIIGATTSFALAADLPSRRAPPVYVAPALPTFTWTGLYAGLNAGYAFSTRSTYTVIGTDPALTIPQIAAGNRPGFVQTNSSGFAGGGQIGYNYQIGATPIPFFGALGGTGAGGLVVGVEADAAYTDLRTSNGVVGANGSTSFFNSRVNYVGTARGRLGVAFGDLLIFGTGGFAYGGVTNTAIFFPGVNNYYGQSSTMRTGYAYGGGLEYAIPTTSFVNFFHSSAVTLKAEFLHYELGSSNTLIANLTTGGSPYIASVKTNGNLVRAGINYKIDFGSPAAVVARY